MTDFLCRQIMSTRKDRKKSAPMPASSAGLLRFFEDDNQGIKIRPQYVLALSAALAVISILMRVFPVI